MVRQVLRRYVPIGLSACHGGRERRIPENVAVEHGEEKGLAPCWIGRFSHFGVFPPERPGPYERRMPEMPSSNGMYQYQTGFGQTQQRNIESHNGKCRS